MEFTNEEKERINQLYGNDFADITPDDALLIGRWEAWKATEDEKHKAEMESMRELSETRINASREEHELAMNNLEELHRLAVERFKAVSDGE